MRTRSGPAPRGGFTLVEILVVIAIIAVLVGMLLVGIQKGRDFGNRTTVVSEINQLDGALTTFNQRYGFYPPSHMVETDTAGVVRVRRFMIPTRIDQPEYFIMRKMFARWTPTLAADGVTISPPLQGAGRKLNGNEAMVYFLGGPGTLLGPNDPTYPGLLTGWDKAAPFAPTGNARDEVFYGDFKEARMTNRSVSPAKYDGQYRDPYGTPYAYFSVSGSQSNDLNEAKVPFPWTSTTTATFARSGGFTETHEYATDTYDPLTDAGTYLTAHPLASSVVQRPLAAPDYGLVTIKWMNAGRFQIVSAGRDQKFGPGTYNPTGYPPAAPPPPAWPALTATQMPQVWTAGSGYYLQGKVGEDDLANFNSGQQLSNPAN